MSVYSVWAIVLSYNGLELTLQCLDSLVAQDYKDLQVLVVDNHSTDSTVESVQAKYSNVHLLPLRENLGYSGGNNAGISYALDNNANAVLLVNNDTRLEKTCVSALVNRMTASPRCGVAGPMVYTWDNWKIISSSGGLIDWRNADAINVGAGVCDTGQFLAAQTDFVNGCAIMVSRAAIESAGMLDDKYFMYWEETDWCTRIRRVGFEVWFEPAARIQHKAPINPSGLSAATLYYMGRNRVLFFARYSFGERAYLAVVRAVMGLLRGWWRNRKAGNLPAACAARRALADVLMRRWGGQDVSAIAACGADYSA